MARSCGGSFAQRVRCLGYCKVDGEQNENVGRLRGDVVDISVPRAEETPPPGKILVCRTDEQVRLLGIHRYIILTGEFRSKWRDSAHLILRLEKETSSRCVK